MNISSRYGLLALFAILLMVGACNSGSNDSYEYTSNCAITSFTLGKLKRVIHTTSSTGEDSTYTITFSGSLYPLTIDQVNSKIYNKESFPKDTELKTLATITADGLVVYAPEGNDSLWTGYSSSDSIDFSTPLLFRVYAYDGSESYREYRINLNVRSNNAYEYTWQKLADIPAMAERTETKLLMQGDEAVLLSVTETGSAYCARSTSTDHPTWTEQECVGLQAIPDVRSAVCYNGLLWMNTANGKLASSTDGINWTAVVQEDEAVGVHLVAASETAIHAVIRDSQQNTSYMASSTDGVTWAPVSMEGQEFFDLPSAAVAYKQNNGNHRVLMCADVLDGGTAPLYQWSLLEGADEPWMLLTDNNVSAYQLPRWMHPILLSYSGMLVALGDRDWSGTHTALDAIYMSYDNGVNWYTYDDLTAPEALVGTTAPVTAATVGEYIWLMAGNQFWRVRYNNYGE